MSPSPGAGRQVRHDARGGRAARCRAGVGGRIRSMPRSSRSRMDAWKRRWIASGACGYERLRSGYGLGLVSRSEMCYESITARGRGAAYRHLPRSPTAKRCMAMRGHGNVARRSVPVGSAAHGSCGSAPAPGGLTGVRTTAQRIIASRKPQAASRKPQAASRKPQAASRKPQAASRKPQAASRKPQAASRKPQAASRKPQAASRKPQAASRKPQAASPS